MESLPKNLKELRESNWQSKSVKQEIHDNLLKALANDETVTYDDVPFTVYLESSVQQYSLGINDLYNYEFDVCEAF